MDMVSHSHVKIIKVRTKKHFSHTCGEGQQRSNTHSTTHTTNTKALPPVRMVVYLECIVMCADILSYIFMLCHSAHILQLSNLLNRHSCQNTPTMDPYNILYVNLMCSTTFYDLNLIVHIRPDTTNNNGHQDKPTQQTP